MSDAGKLCAVLVALLALAPGVRAQSERPAPAERSAASATGLAEPAEAAIVLSRRGADLLRQGQHQQAAEVLQQALGAEDGTLDEPGALAATRYNLALAQANAGDPAAASAQLAKLEAEEVTGGMAPELRSKARFNRGHALFTEAAKLAETDATGAIDRYLLAAEAFRLAAALGGAEAARAARNVEISRIAAQRLRDQMERERQRQEQAQQMADQLRDLAERQHELADESQARAQEDPSEQSEQDNQDLQQRQEELRQQAQELQQQLEQMAQQQQNQPRQSEQTPEEGAADDIRQATESQDQASRDLGEQQPDEAAEAQQRAAELLRQAADRLGAGEQQQQQDGEGEQQQEGDQGQQAQQSQQEGESEQRDAIAEALLDKERAERAARQHIRGQLGRIVPVEKDW